MAPAEENLFQQDIFSELTVNFTYLLQHALCQYGALGEICFGDSKPPTHVSTGFQFHT